MAISSLVGLAETMGPEAQPQLSAICARQGRLAVSTQSSTNSSRNPSCSTPKSVLLMCFPCPTVQSSSFAKHEHCRLAQQAHAAAMAASRQQHQLVLATHDEQAP